MRSCGEGQWRWPLQHPNPTTTNPFFWVGVTKVMEVQGATLKDGAIGSDLGAVSCAAEKTASAASTI